VEEARLQEASRASVKAALMAFGELAWIGPWYDSWRRPYVSTTGGWTLPRPNYQIGGHAIRWIDTPHVPHAWEAGLVYDEKTRTLFCGDLFARTGSGPPLTGNDIVEPAMEAEDFYGLTSLGPATAPNIRGLAKLNPKTLALMHGSSFTGDASSALHALADRFDARLRAALK
jgi:hypothetical protein